MTVNIKELVENKFDIENCTPLSETENTITLREDRVPYNYSIKKDKENLFGCSIQKLLNKEFYEYEDSGFFYDGYIEILINNTENMEFILDDNINVIVGEPTVLFEVVMTGIICDDYYSKDSYKTISLSGEGLTKDLVNKYISKALFKIGLANNSFGSDNYPEVYKFTGESDYYDIEQVEKIILNLGAELKRKSHEDSIGNYEPLAYYNSAVITSDFDAKFHYFYKSVEFYFFKIDANDSEKKQLLNVLKNCGNDINQLVQYANGTGLINTDSIMELKNKIYSRRCEIVHAKRNSINKVPYYIKAIDGKEEKWANLMQALSLIVIRTNPSK